MLAILYWIEYKCKRQRSYYDFTDVFHTYEYLTSIKITQPVVPLFLHKLIALESMMSYVEFISNFVHQKWVWSNKQQKYVIVLCLDL